MSTSIIRIRPEDIASIRARKDQKLTAWVYFDPEGRDPFYWIHGIDVLLKTMTVAKSDAAGQAMLNGSFYVQFESLEEVKAMVKILKDNIEGNCFKVMLYDIEGDFIGNIVETCPV